MIQKIINVFALSSFAVSSAVVGGGVYVYLQRDSIIDGIKKEVIGNVGGALAGGALTGDVGIPSGEAAAVGGTSIDIPSL
jgi:hypothetical protein